VIPKAGDIVDVNSLFKTAKGLRSKYIAKLCHGSCWAERNCLTQKEKNGYFRSVE